MIINFKEPRILNEDGIENKYDIVTKLKNEEKIDDVFLLKLSLLSLEEIITLKYIQAFSRTGIHFPIKIFDNLGELMSDVFVNVLLASTNGDSCGELDMEEIKKLYGEKNG